MAIWLALRTGAWQIIATELPVRRSRAVCMPHCWQGLIDTAVVGATLCQQGLRPGGQLLLC